MPVTFWKDTVLQATTKKNALDGIEEWCQTAWLPQAKTDCPVDSGTMRNSLMVERASDGCYVGGGGAASDYIMRQELDRSLQHAVGKAGFISDSVNDQKGKLLTIVKKHVQ